MKDGYGKDESVTRKTNYWILRKGEEHVHQVQQRSGTGRHDIIEFRHGWYSLSSHPLGSPNKAGVTFQIRSHFHGVTGVWFWGRVDKAPSRFI
jgi:hypothetical protein